MKFIKFIRGDSFYKHGKDIVRVCSRRATRSCSSWEAQIVKMNDDFTGIARDKNNISCARKSKIIAFANTKKEVIQKVINKKENK
mgnify:CR=1 FL=1